MKREEYENLPHILSVETNDGIGTEIDAGDDNKALMLAGAIIVATIKFMDKENHADALDSLRNLLNAYPMWIIDPEFNKTWEEA